MNALKNSVLSYKNLEIPYLLLNTKNFFSLGLNGVIIQFLLQSHMQIIFAQTAQMLQLLQVQILQNQILEMRLQMQMRQLTHIYTMEQIELI